MPLTKPRPSLMRPSGHKKSKSTVETTQKPVSHKKSWSTLGNKIGPASPSPRQLQRPDATLLEEDEREEDEYYAGSDNARNNAGAIAAANSRRDEAGSSGGLFSMPDFRLQGLLSRARRRIKERGGRDNGSASSPDSPSGPLSPDYYSVSKASKIREEKTLDHRHLPMEPRPLVQQKPQMASPAIRPLGLHLSPGRWWHVVACGSLW